MNILEVKDLKKYYGQGENQVKALDGISLSVKQGEFLAVVGTSGSGKSTLLHMMGGLDTPTSGQVIVAGKDISTLSRDELTIFRRRKIGFVFQSYNLLPLMNVYDNIVLPIKLDGIRPDETYVEQILVSLGLEEKRCAMPNQLSGGQQQRVALARALAAKPAIILADEPTGNLDSRTSMDVLGLMKTSGERFGQTIVMITHNDEIAQMAGALSVWKMGESADTADSPGGGRKSLMKAEGQVLSMLKVSNRKIIAEIAAVTYKANGKRNLLAVFAMFLTTFLISVIIVLGVSYWNTISQRQIRMEGMDYDVELTEPEERQVQIIRIWMKSNTPGWQ